MNRYLRAKGAYGRTYKTEAEVMADWEAGKDFFSLEHNSYFSIRDKDYLTKDFWCGIIFILDGGKVASTSFKTTV